MNKTENPILRGFSPDPSMIRVGDDFYIACSTFEWWPGVNIFHSKDCINWHLLTSPLKNRSQLDMRGNPVNGGIWAPCLSYYNGLFFLAYTDTKTQKHQYYNAHNYFVWTDNINGEWSEPIYLTSSGFDPSIFHEGDKKYLMWSRHGFKGILLQELNFEKKALVGEAKTIFLGTEWGFTEGPHIYKHGEYYYLLTAEGGTGYGHCVTLARAKDIWGPYEINPQNPILTSSKDENAPLKRAGHASLVEIDGDKAVLAFLCSRSNEFCSTLGRETALQTFYWNEEKWLESSTGNKNVELIFESPIEVNERIKVDKDSYLDSNGQISPYYKSMRAPIEGIRVVKDRIVMPGRESIMSNFNVSLLAKRQEEFTATAQVEVKYVATEYEHAAGISYLYNNENFFLLIRVLEKENQEVLKLWKCEKAQRWELINQKNLESDSDRIFMRIDVTPRKASFAYSFDSKNWVYIAEKQDSTFLSDEECKGFTGAHLAIYCHDISGDEKEAEFINFHVEQ